MLELEIMIVRVDIILLKVVNTHIFKYLQLLRFNFSFENCKLYLVQLYFRTTFIEPD